MRKQKSSGICDTFYLFIFFLNVGMVWGKIIFIFFGLGYRLDDEGVFCFGWGGRGGGAGQLGWGKIGFFFFFWGVGGAGVYIVEEECFLC